MLPLAQFQLLLFCNESQHLERSLEKEEKANNWWHFVDFSWLICLFQMINSRHAAQFLHQRSLCLWIWRITTARPWTSSSPPHPLGHSRPHPSPPPKWTALSPTWTCSTWRTAPNQMRQSTETWTPSSGPMGQRTARRARAMRSSRSRWGTLPTWMKSKRIVLVFITQRENNVC